MEMTDELYARITALCAEGDALAEEDDGLADAKLKFEEALQLMPGDPLDWEMGTWIFCALGDMAYLSGDLAVAHEHFNSAVRGPGGLGQPFIHLRLGEIAFEDGRMDRAADELTRAYMGAGLEVFELEDPKYLAFLRTKIHMDE